MTLFQYARAYRYDCAIAIEVGCLVIAPPGWQSGLGEKKWGGGAEGETLRMFFESSVGGSGDWKQILG